MDDAGQYTRTHHVRRLWQESFQCLEELPPDYLAIASKLDPEVIRRSREDIDSAAADARPAVSQAVLYCELNTVFATDEGGNDIDIVKFVRRNR